MVNVYTFAIQKKTTWKQLQENTQSKRNTKS